MYQWAVQGNTSFHPPATSYRITMHWESLAWHAEVAVSQAVLHALPLELSSRLVRHM